MTLCPIFYMAQVVEAPAGLMDANETIAEAARRELREETGHEGVVVAQSPPAVLDPGVSDANTVYVDTVVDAHMYTESVAQNDEG